MFTPRRTLQGASLLALAAACALGVARCEDEAVLLAALASVAAVALLGPALLWNRHTLPLALVAGALPALLALRAHAYPAYDIPVAGLLLVVCAECAARSWYANSLAPHGNTTRWFGALAVVLLAGAVAGAAILAAARVRLDGAVLLTAIGAGALVIAGLVAARATAR